MLLSIIFCGPASPALLPILIELFQVSLHLWYKTHKLFLLKDTEVFGPRSYTQETMDRVRTLFRTLRILSSWSSSVASIQIWPTPNSCTSCLFQIHFSSKSDPLPLHSMIYCLLCPVCLVPQDVGRTPRPRFPLTQRTWKSGARFSPEGWARVPKTWGAALGPSTAAVALSSEGFFFLLFLSPRWGCGPSAMATGAGLI